ncbi:Late competence protein ComEA DNA receptor [Anoxybacillus flavithermus]|uniref:Late competence protein ComEA DNA receptor n=1 Tax=Anoxybacillus flavithermus TaxID=33934 RepID=A0A178TFR2_9BACL|nr:Late competence protein ComEA DNA receptor [Anoxybacillus flavithermus]
MKWIKTYERWVYVGLIVIGATIWIIQQQEDPLVQPLSLEQVERTTSRGTSLRCCRCERSRQTSRSI